MLLNGTHNSLSINRILLSLSDRITLHGSIVKSPVLTLPLIFINCGVLSSTCWSISESWNILSYLWSLSRFANLFLNLLILHFSIWHDLRTVKELFISSELWVLRNRILSLKDLIYLSRSQHISGFVWLVMDTVVHVWNQTLILILLLFNLTVCFVLSTNSSFWIVSCKLVVVYCNI